MEPSRTEVLDWLQDWLRRPLSPADQADVLGSAGCAGDDAIELIKAFSDRFVVDLRGYRQDLHHATEGQLLRPNWPLPAQSRVLVPLSVTMLHRAAVHGRWPLVYPDLPEGQDFSWANPLLIMTGLVGATLAVLWLVPRLF